MANPIGRRTSGIAAGALALVATLVWPGSLHVSAQGSRASQPTPPGWVFSPGISVGETWDNNVLLATEGNDSVTDFLTAVTPRAALGFRGRRDTFQLDYRGSFHMYQELSELNAFDQRASASFNHRITPTVSLFARNSLSRSPTTDDIEVPDVRFRRQGVLMDDFRAGAEARLNNRTSLMAAYTFQYVDFEDDEALLTVDGLRRGGHGHGGAAQFDYRLGPRVGVGAEYEMRHATVDEVNEFDVMNMLGTVSWRIDERLDFSAGAGYAWLSTGPSEERQSAPAFRVGLSGSGARLGWNIGYRRSFLPSFGFGGTFQNQEFQASVLAPITRRLDISGSFALRENDPLSDDPLLLEAYGLRSIWARSSISYLATRWLRIEGFYTAAFQDSQRPGGEVNRSRLGVQVVTSTRMRVR